MIEKVLTFGNGEGEPKFYSGNIIDFFKAAGFKTFWISNQYMYGAYDSTHSSIVSTAKKSTFINRNDWRTNKTDVKDCACWMYIKRI